MSIKQSLLGFKEVQIASSMLILLSNNTPFLILILINEKKKKKTWFFFSFLKDISVTCSISSTTTLDPMNSALSYSLGVSLWLLENLCNLYNTGKSSLSGKSKVPEITICLLGWGFITKQYTQTHQAPFLVRGRHIYSWHSSGWAFPLVIRFMVSLWRAERAIGCTHTAQTCPAPL